MQRYNLFNQIHKALRVLLYDTATLIGRTDFDDPSQYAIVNARLKQVLNSFDNHAGHEDAMILPLLAQYEPAVVNVFEEEHHIDHALSQKLKGSLMALDHAISSEAKSQLGASLGHSFVEFMIFNLQHMAKEESILNNLLWKYYSDEELLSVSKKLVASIPAEEVNYTSGWMMKGLSNDEIIAWLRNVERNAPPFVFRQLFTTAEKELEQFRFRKIMEGITEDAMIAS
jgi:hypothetical protein